MSRMCSKADVQNGFGVYPIDSVEVSPENKKSAAVWGWTLHRWGCKAPSCV